MGGDLQAKNLVGSQPRRKVQSSLWSRARSGPSATSTVLPQIADVIGGGIRVGDHVAAYFR
jgi:hypothetical protein